VVSSVAKRLRASGFIAVIVFFAPRARGASGFCSACLARARRSRKVYASGVPDLLTYSTRSASHSISEPNLVADCDPSACAAPSMACVDWAASTNGASELWTGVVTGSGRNVNRCTTNARQRPSGRQQFASTASHAPQRQS
jgi:hypothetical protein